MAFEEEFWRTETQMRSQVKGARSRDGYRFGGHSDFMKRSRLGVALVLVGPAMLGGCSSGANSDAFVGTWSGDNGQILVLKSNGDATGNDGCNDLGGGWKSTGESAGELRIKEMTLKACAEGKSWSEASRFELTDSEIAIKDEVGTDLGRLSVRIPG